jgi:hypothetical protein
MVKLVTVLSSADPIEIELARNVLDSAGLPCVVEGGRADAQIEAVVGSYSGLAGAKAVRVREDDAGRASELLEQAFGDGTGRS